MHAGSRGYSWPAAGCCGMLRQRSSKGDGATARACSAVLSWHAAGTRPGADAAGTAQWLGDSPCSGSGRSQRAASGVNRRSALEPRSTQSRLWKGS